LTQGGDTHWKHWKPLSTPIFQPPSNFSDQLSDREGTAETKEEDISGLPVPQCSHLMVSALVVVVTFFPVHVQENLIEFFYFNYR
jgi:hypothetical protein